MWLQLFCTHLLTIFIFSKAADLENLRLLDDLISYKISFKSANEEIFYKNDDSENWISMMSADEEEYRCLLPTVETIERKRIETYTGPTPVELLRPLYADNTCYHRIDSYWIYEVCHGRYILQYHEDKESKIRNEFYLGNYVKVDAEAEASKFDQLNPPTRKFDKESVPYFAVTYNMGTTCDLTNTPRQTTILYACGESHKSIIFSVTEVKSCQYEVVVFTNRLCAHPSFYKAPVKEHDVHCFATNPKQNNPKPKSLASYDRFTTIQFFKELVGKTSDSPINFLKDPENTAEQIEQYTLFTDALKVLNEKMSTRTLSDKILLIEKFWLGEECLTGGSGWWKYEVCHGHTITQFHEEPGTERKNILLGTFYKKIHEEWAKENLQQARKTNKDNVYQISNLYSQGDICSETGAHRSTVVSIRCDKNSKTDIFVYLLEPKTCSYILVVESSLLCPGLQKSNEYGLLPEMPQLKGDIPEPKEVSSKESHFELNKQDFQDLESQTNNQDVKSIKIFSVLSFKEMVKLVDKLERINQIDSNLNKLKKPNEEKETDKDEQEEKDKQKEMDEQKDHNKLYHSEP